MSRRTFILVLSGLASLLALMPVPAASGYPLRTPQVPVFSGRLQNYLDGLQETIRVDTDQLAVQSLVADLSDCTRTLDVELGGDAAGVDSIGVYDASAASPQRVCVFPAEASAGWFASLTFRTGPDRLVVVVFDQLAISRSTTTYPGADWTSFAFWLQGPAGIVYMQDARNTGGVAQMLGFAGTGIYSGAQWICLEDQPVGSGSDQDYDDAVLLISHPCDIPVIRSTWGELKRRFR